MMMMTAAKERMMTMMAIPLWELMAIQSETDSSSYVRGSLTVLNSGFYVEDSGFQYFSVELGFLITIVSEIPDSLSCIPDSISKIFPDSGSTSKNFLDSGIRIPLHGARYTI